MTGIINLGHYHKALLEDCLLGVKTKQTPIAFWRHFPVDDQSTDTFVKAIVAFQNQYDFDFVKITPASSFCVKDWGIRDKWTGSLEGTREYLNRVINSPEDWNLLSVLDPFKGSLGQQLKCLKLLKSALPTGTPIIQTIFNPLSQAKNLAGKDRLLSHLISHSKEVTAGLRTIEKTTTNFIIACQEIGLDGFFFALQFSQSSLLSMEEARKLEFVPLNNYLKLAHSCWLNIIHLHGENIFFTDAIQTSAPILNWHDQKTSPNLSTAKIVTNKTLCGGIQQWETLVFGDPNLVAAESKKAIEEMGGSHLILGTGCVLPITAPMSNIYSAINVARNRKI